MRIEYVFKCDAPGCEKEFRGKAGFSLDIHTDYSRDPADGRSEKEFKTVDLCATCYKRLLEYLVDAMDIKDRVELAKKWGAN